MNVHEIDPVQATIEDWRTIEPEISVILLLRDGRILSEPVAHAKIVKSVSHFGSCEISAASIVSRPLSLLLPVMSNSTVSLASSIFTSLSEGELASILRAYVTSGPDVGSLLDFVNSTRPDLLEPEDPAGYIRYSILVIFAVLTSTTVLAVLIVVFGTHKILRYPLLIFFAALCAVELCLYVLVRQLVRAMEKVFPVFRKSWRSRRHQLRRLTEAKNYEAYKEAARELDKSVSWIEKWKNTNDSVGYSSLCIKSHGEELRCAKSLEHKLALLRQILVTGFAGIGTDEYLFSKSFLGTKKCITDFYESVVDTIDEVTAHLETVTSRKNDSIEKHLFSEFLNDIMLTFGQPALCLSGGGMMALMHFGIVETMIEQGCLPKVICGTSGGSVVASYLCTHTDDELPRIVKPEVVQPKWSPCGDSWWTCIKRFSRTGYMFDPLPWHNLLADLLGDRDITFLEAFQRTNRVLVLTCSSNSSTGGEPLLLHYRSAPNVLVRSAILCSSAMPYLLPPQPLLIKDPETGEITRYTGGGAFASENSYFMDGSLQADTPQEGLGEMFHAHVFITSQVNPHIIPFFFWNKGEAGRPLNFWREWRGGFLLSSLEVFLKEELRKNARLVSQLELLPQHYSADWSRLFLQTFDGNITVTPPTLKFWYFTQIMTNPTPEVMEDYFQEGRQMIFPKMEMIRLRFKVDNAITRLHRAVQARWSVTPLNRPPPEAVEELGDNEESTPSSLDMIRSEAGRYTLRRRASSRKVSRM